MICPECRRNPCHSNCPNAESAAVVGRCASCGDEILEGEAIMKMGEQLICRYCRNEMTAEDVLEGLGYVRKIAEVAHE